jgi:hypothetical protein
MEAVIIAVIVIAALAIIFAAVGAARAKRRRHLQDRFGPEYDRTVEGADRRRDAERDLREREQAHDELDLRDLSAAERARYKEQWDTVQSSFVDRPETAVRDADLLVGRVMRDRGYPVDDFEQKADLVSVDHPEVVTHYRHAHRVSEQSTHGDVSTEDQREAFVHYRALFDELLDTGGHHDDREVDHV